MKKKKLLGILLSGAAGTFLQGSRLPVPTTTEEAEAHMTAAIMASLEHKHPMATTAEEEKAYTAAAMLNSLEEDYEKEKKAYVEITTPLVTRLQNLKTPISRDELRTMQEQLGRATALFVIIEEMAKDLKSPAELSQDVWFSRQKQGLSWIATKLNEAQRRAPQPPPQRPARPASPVRRPPTAPTSTPPQMQPRSAIKNVASPQELAYAQQLEREITKLANDERMMIEMAQDIYGKALRPASKANDLDLRNAIVQDKTQIVRLTPESAERSRQIDLLIEQMNKLQSLGESVELTERTPAQEEEEKREHVGAATGLGAGYIVHGGVPMAAKPTPRKSAASADEIVEKSLEQAMALYTTGYGYVGSTKIVKTQHFTDISFVKMNQALDIIDKLMPLVANVTRKELLKELLDFLNKIQSGKQNYSTLFATSGAGKQLEAKLNEMSDSWLPAVRHVLFD